MSQANEVNKGVTVSKSGEKPITIAELLLRAGVEVDGKFDEDLHQYLLIHIALNINKFTF